MTPFETEISCDLLVVGSGFAGMAATARAAHLGLDVVRAGNPSQFYFASGAMEALGVYPLEQGFLKGPSGGWDSLVKGIPDHPYAKSSWEKLVADFTFITDFLGKAGLTYVGGKDPEQNMLIPTALGTFKPVFRAPVTMAKGATLMEEGTGGQLLLVDFSGLKGFSAAQMASGLTDLEPNRFSLVCAGPHARNWQIQTRRVTLAGTQGGIDPLHLAFRFEDPEFLERVILELSEDAKNADLLGLPAVCGLDHCQSVMARLEEGLGIPVFEIPMMPPSIPGIRLKNAFEQALSGLPYLGSARICRPEGWDRDGGIYLTAHAPSLETRIRCRGVILATGSFPGGGLAGDRKKIHETVFDLPVFQPESRECWHEAEFFTPKGHGVHRAGILTDGAFSPVDDQGRRIHKQLYAAGAILAHNDWTRLKTGAGVACLSAITAVDDFFGQKGAGHA